MAVETCQFRVAGVDRETGEDVSIVIEAATKAAAEVKADKQGIDTTHIVPLRDPAAEFAAKEENLYAVDAAEARMTTPTDKLIEVCVPEEEVTDDAEAYAESESETTQIVGSIARPAYTSPVVSWVPSTPHTSLGMVAFVLAVLCGISAGGYFVLIHEPSKVSADTQRLEFGEDLYVDVIGSEVDVPGQTPMQSNAFSRQPTHGTEDATAPQTERPQNLVRPDGAPAFVLQSVVVSHEGRFAILNGQLYKQGSEIAGCTLVSVADDWVLMQWGGAQFVVELKPNTPDPQAGTRQR